PVRRSHVPPSVRSVRRGRTDQTRRGAPPGQGPAVTAERRAPVTDHNGAGPGRSGRMAGAEPGATVAPRFRPLLPAPAPPPCAFLAPAFGHVPRPPVELDTVVAAGGLPRRRRARGQASSRGGRGRPGERVRGGPGPGRSGWPPGGSRTAPGRKGRCPGRRRRSARPGRTGS